MKKLIILCGLMLGLGACGTTYVLPEIDETVSSRAKTMFAEASNETVRPLQSTSVAENRFHRVVARVKPVATGLCERETAKLNKFDCNVHVEIDRERNDRNAYFTYDGGRPVIRMTMPLLQDAASDDEVAFVLGHEYGHLLGQHIQKQQQQAVVGALILGTLAAYANAQSAAYGGQYDATLVQDSVDLGAAIGSVAYSQTYELESDTLGTLIAKSAGYDPVRGAQYFARSEKPRTEEGKLSFWGTHPPNEKRLATVIAITEEIEANRGVRRKAN